ncbi:hypothetical protein KCV07_g506, partial [Aureobasidium melanogenum]
MWRSQPDMRFTDSLMETMYAAARNLHNIRKRPPRSATVGKRGLKTCRQGGSIPREMQRTGHVLLGHTFNPRHISSGTSKKQRFPHTIETSQSPIQPNLMYVRVIGLRSRLVFCSSRLQPHGQFDMS